MVEVTIAICTYKRPEIKQTLVSVANQILPDNMSIRVVVADNDIEPIARGQIKEIANDLGLIVDYIHAPFQNISIARNACLKACKSGYLVFIDDDEVATQGWLQSLIDKAKSTGAEVVFGPVEAVYEKNAPEWLVKIDLHSTAPVYVNGKIETGYTGNTLLNLDSSIINSLEFDIDKGKTGGEDTDFLHKAFLLGATLEYCKEAVVKEKVPESRASIEWLKARRIRVGKTYGGTLLNVSIKRSWVLSNILISLFKVIYCQIMRIIFLKKNDKKIWWYLRSCFHFGVLTRLMGKKEEEHY